ncbi:hypothetical protein AAMO2058_000274700 [Amorphochlora amoebiformis]
MADDSRWALAFLVTLVAFLWFADPDQVTSLPLRLDASSYGEFTRSKSMGSLPMTTNALDEEEEYWESRISEIMMGDSNTQSSPQQTDMVNRVMTTFTLNPYEILNIRFDATKRNVSVTYHRISALIHPDKCPHPAAREAFQRVKNAHDTLMNNDTAKRYVFMINGIKNLLIEEKEKNLMSTKRNSPTERIKGNRKKTMEEIAEETKEEVERWQKTDDYHHKWKVEVRKVLVRAEWRLKRTVEYNQGKKERDANIRDKRKHVRVEKKSELDDWDNFRDNRVGNWRKFLLEKVERKRRKREQKNARLHSIRLTKI